MLILFADIDECQTDEHNCNQTCTNTNGYFECSCRAGYSLQGDGVSCEGMHTFIAIRCIEYVRACVCASQYTCVCAAIRTCEGVCTVNSLCYFRLGDLLRVFVMFDPFVDVNECQTDEHNCNQTCSNTLGSFECSCRPGYSLQGDGVTCEGMNAFISAVAWGNVCVCVSVRSKLDSVDS